MDATLALLVEDLDRLLAEPAVPAQTNEDERWQFQAAARVSMFRDALGRYLHSSDHADFIYHDLTDADPRVEPLVRRLRVQSRRLIECCDRAVATLDEPAVSTEACRAAVADLSCQANRYRSLESTATHEAVAVDLGSDG